MAALTRAISQDHSLNRALHLLEKREKSSQLRELYWKNEMAHNTKSYNKTKTQEPEKVKEEERELEERQARYNCSSVCSSFIPLVQVCWMVSLSLPY